MGSRDTTVAEKELTPDEQLAVILGTFFADPLGYVMFNFPWDTYAPIQMVELQSPYKERFPGCKYGPDVWACKFLDDWGDDIAANAFNGRDSVDPLQYATVSGHGIEALFQRGTQVTGGQELEEPRRSASQSVGSRLRRFRRWDRFPSPGAGYLVPRSLSRFCPAQRWCEIGRAHV